MNRINYLKANILFVFLLFGSATSTFSNDFGSVLSIKSDYNLDPAECDEIEVTLEITNTTNSQQNGKIFLNFKKSTSSYTCFIFSGNSQDNRFDIEDNQASGLAKGEYNLYIQNKNGCTKHVKFKIN